MMTYIHLEQLILSMRIRIGTPVNSVVAMGKIVLSIIRSFPILMEKLFVLFVSMFKDCHKTA